MSDMTAVIETGGKQYRVRPGDTIQIEKLNVEPGSEVAFDRVLMVTGDGGLKTGNPVIEGARVVGKLVEEIKGEKIIAFKYKRRKNYRRKVGHRQRYSIVKIEGIQAGDSHGS